MFRFFATFVTYANLNLEKAGFGDRLVDFDSIVDRNSYTSFEFG